MPLTKYAPMICSVKPLNIGKGKGAQEPKAQMTEAYPGFFRTKHT